MPWALRMVLTISMLSVIVYFFVAIQLADAAARLFPVSLRSARLVGVLVALLLNLLPVLIFIGSVTGQWQHLYLVSDHIHWLDFLLTYPYWWGFILVMEILPYFLAMYLVNLAAWLAGVGPANRWWRWQALLKVGIACLLAVYVGVKSYWDTSHIRLTTSAAPVRGLPASLSGLKVTLIGDVQVDRYTSEAKLRKFRQQVDSADGDLLLFAGDLITDGYHFIPRALREFGDIRAPLGRVACLGDHDFWSAPDYIAHGLTQKGWLFLDNQHHLFHCRGKTILVTGVTYIYSRRISSSALELLLADAPAADLKIMLVHQPAQSVITAAERHGYHLLLAGHTHGGQIVFHPFGIALTPTQKENDFYTGSHRQDALNIVVTNGIGLTLAALRYGAPAEVNQVRVQAEK